jgi:thiol-disulfide isomerase/thioredoxin
MANMKKGIIFILIVVVLVLGASLVLKKDNGPSPLDDFATCLKDKGAVFYGAFWCPHCRDQKKMFGASVKKLPYVECSTADGQSQLPVCKDKNVTGYPTWDFQVGTTTERITGLVPLKDLSEKTGCMLPESFK